MSTMTLNVTKRKRATIYHDADPESPRAWDNLGTMACWHRGYVLGDVQPKATPDAHMKSLKGKHLVLPLYLLDHSGITMRTTPFSCPWDSGQVGWIYVSHEVIRQQYGEVTEETIERARSVLVGEVDTYDVYLRGEVYGYTVDEVLVDEDGDIVKVLGQVDSCWGFYHSPEYPALESMKEHVPTEEHALLDEAWERGIVYR